MDRAKKKRAAQRSAVTRITNEIKNELEKENPDLMVLQVKFESLETKEADIGELDQQILDAMVEADSPENEIEEEDVSASGYREKIAMSKLQINSVLHPRRRTPSPTPSHHSLASTTVSESSKRTYKLPKIEVKKFSGNLVDWLGFWAQFQKIDEDDDLHASDKYQYLVQSMVSGTRAMELVESYPQTAENYPKVIEALTDRFGKKKILMQVYVRELLKMVISNNGAREKITICRMYDRLESHLRALESLGVTTEQMAIFLFPMVESSLPEDILIAWQRSPLNGCDGSNEIPPKTELNFLMQFLRQEVENQEQRTLVQAGFSNSVKEKKKQQGQANNQKSNANEDIATASGLFSGEKSKCVFCDGSHESRECMKARDMSMDDKKSKIKTKNCCFICLRPGHQSKKCKAFIKCMLCSRKHAIVMCPDLPVHRNGYAVNINPPNAVETLSTNLACSAKVILKTLMVTIVGKYGKKKVRAIIDDGSQRSYILKSVADDLRLVPNGEEDLVHALFSGVQTNVKRHRTYDIQIENVSGKGQSRLKVLDQNRICGEIPRLSYGPWMKTLKENKIWISDLTNSGENPEIEMLIGADAIGRLLTGKIVQIPNGLTAVETILGWTLMGKVESQDPGSVAMTVTSMIVSDASLQQLWDLETLGINDPGEIKSKAERDEDTKQHFLKTVSRNNDGRYSVSLPWSAGVQRIPDNKLTAEKRLVNMSRKLQAEGKFKVYSEIFESWEAEGIIEVVDESQHGNPSYYLPHRAVFKPESLTTPVRPVFDASCKTQRNPSLNECLEKGPNLLELIPSIFLQFREKKIGVVSDIRKAFQMIEMEEEDRDFLRFLWWEDSSQKKLKIYRHCRVVFGVNSSPFLLGAVLEYHLNTVKEDKPIVEKFRKSLYVDNCVSSSDTIEECVEFKEKSTAIMSDARMDLRQWECGSAEVPGVGQLASSWCGLGTGRSNVLGHKSTSNVLGMAWDKTTDTLHSDLNIQDLPEKITKRTILSLTQKIFDPIGFTCPTTIVPKLLLQSLWNERVGWDEEVSGEVKVKFQQWYRELNLLKEIRIPRNYTAGVSSRENWQIHTFCDASSLAYAAVVFLRTEYNSQVSIQLLQAKSRVAPLKKITIPRLELMGCTVAARLTDSVEKSLTLNDVPVTFWSDSTTALAWIRRNNNWGTFVGNRVKEICELTKVQNWRFVPGTLNPADLPSRGCSTEQLWKSKWWEGKEWLLGPENEWPCWTEQVDEDAVNAEKRKSAVVSMVNSSDENYCFARCSSFDKNVSIFGWIKRFVDKTLGKSTLKGPLSIKELDLAEKQLLKLIQIQTLPVGESVVSGVRVVTDEDGLVRVKTKISYRDDAFGFRFPILLPHSHVLVDQLIRDQHLKQKHAGVQFLMGFIREKYWIIQSRRAIRRVLNKCVVCRRYSTKKPEVVPTALPADRVEDARVFQVVGVDLAGPLYLKDKSKCWVVLYTCAVYRAVHLELVTSLSSEGFLLSLRRFICRRGRPSTIYCDNGTNFVGSHNALRDLGWKKIQADSEAKKIVWKFNPPSAPWWGGWWERLVRSMKDLLKRNLGRSSLNFEELMTSLCDAEAIINGRPLTYVTEDAEDLIPLTPSMFLQDVTITDVRDLDELDSHGFQKRYRYRQKLRDELRSRFRKEYLAQLVQHGKDKKLQTFAVGDIVLVGSEKKRMEWPMAKIIELLPGKDGHVRVVKLKTALGILLRPIQRLCHLEVSSNPEQLPITPELKEMVVKKIAKVKVIEEKPNICTKSGRKVIPPNRLGL